MPNLKNIYRKEIVVTTKIATVELTYDDLDTIVSIIEEYPTGSKEHDLYQFFEATRLKMLEER